MTLCNVIESVVLAAVLECCLREPVQVGWQGVLCFLALGEVCFLLAGELSVNLSLELFERVERDWEQFAAAAAGLQLEASYSFVDSSLHLGGWVHSVRSPPVSQSVSVMAVPVLQTLEDHGPCYYMYSHCMGLSGPSAETPSDSWDAASPLRSDGKERLTEMDMALSCDTHVPLGQTWEPLLASLLMPDTLLACHRKVQTQSSDTPAVVVGTGNGLWQELMSVY